METHVSATPRPSDEAMAMQEAGLEFALLQVGQFFIVGMILGLGLSEYAITHRPVIVGGIVLLAACSLVAVILQLRLFFKYLHQPAGGAQ